MKVNTHKNQYPWTVRLKHVQIKKKYGWVKPNLSLRTTLNLIKFDWKKHDFFLLFALKMITFRRERLIRAFLAKKEKPHFRWQILNLILWKIRGARGSAKEGERGWSGRGLVSRELKRSSWPRRERAELVVPLDMMAVNVTFLKRTSHFVFSLSPCLFEKRWK